MSWEMNPELGVYTASNASLYNSATSLYKSSLSSVKNKITAQISAWPVTKPPVVQEKKKHIS